VTAETHAVAATLPWWQAGERFVSAALDRLADEEFDAPSLLPGWTRRHVFAHLACNADALINLLTWARTGVETPMYASAVARDSAIEQAAALAADGLRALVLSTTARLAEAIAAMPARSWQAPVRTAQGRTVPAEEVLWMRCREVWVHVVDLDAGAGFADIPEEVQVALIADVFRAWARRDIVPDIVLRADTRTWGAGRRSVSGPLPAATTWITGRGDGSELTADGPLPVLARWL
jgi:maleylpyruvate isomerase